MKEERRRDAGMCGRIGGRREREVDGSEVGVGGWEGGMGRGVGDRGGGGRE